MWNFLNLISKCEFFKFWKRYVLIFKNFKVKSSRNEVKIN